MRCVHTFGSGCAWSFDDDPWMVYLWTCAHLNDLPTDLPLMKSTAWPLYPEVHSSSGNTGGVGVLSSEANNTPPTNKVLASMATEVVPKRIKFERA